MLVARNIMFSCDTAQLRGDTTVGYSDLTHNLLFNHHIYSAGAHGQGV